MNHLISATSLSCLMIVHLLSPLTIGPTPYCMSSVLLYSPQYSCRHSSCTKYSLISVKGVQGRGIEALWEQHVYIYIDVYIYGTVFFRSHERQVIEPRRGHCDDNHHGADGSHSSAGQSVVLMRELWLLCFLVRSMGMTGRRRRRRRRRRGGRSCRYCF